MQTETGQNKKDMFSSFIEINEKLFLKLVE